MHPAAEGDHPQDDRAHIPAGIGRQWLRDREVLAAVCRFPEGIAPRCLPPLVSRGEDTGASLVRLARVGLVEQDGEAIYATARGLQVIAEVDPLSRDVIAEIERVA